MMNVSLQQLHHAAEVLAAARKPEMSEQVHDALHVLCDAVGDLALLGQYLRQAQRDSRPHKIAQAIGRLQAWLDG